MFGLEIQILAIVCLAVATGGIVKGVTGIGLPIVSIAILLNFLDPMTTLATIIGPLLVTNLWQAVSSGDLRPALRRFWPMTLCFFIFLLIGAQLVVGLDEKVMFAVLGAVVASFALMNLLRPRPHALGLRAEKWLSPLAGAAGGLLGGLTTIWGPPMMMLFVLLKLDKDEWVRTVGLIWFIGSVPLAFAYWQNGILSGERIPLTLVACVPGMLGILAGEWVRRRIDQESFRKVLLIALALIGLNLIRRAVF